MDKGARLRAWRARGRRSAGRKPAPSYPPAPSWKGATRSAHAPRAPASRSRIFFFDDRHHRKLEAVSRQSFCRVARVRSVANGNSAERAPLPTPVLGGGPQGPARGPMLITVRRALCRALAEFRNSAFPLARPRTPSSLVPPDVRICYLRGANAVRREVSSTPCACLASHPCQHGSDPGLSLKILADQGPGSRRASTVPPRGSAQRAGPAARLCPSRAGRARTRRGQASRCEREIGPGRSLRIARTSVACPRYGLAGPHAYTFTHPFSSVKE